MAYKSPNEEEILRLRRGRDKFNFVYFGQAQREISDSGIEKEGKTSQKQISDSGE